MSETPSKICAICGQDCSARPRTKDAKGRYFCKPCYEKAAAEKHATAASPHSASPPPPAAVVGPPAVGSHSPTRKPDRRFDEDQNQGEYGLEAAPVSLPAVVMPTDGPTHSTDIGSQVGASDATVSVCPSCARPLPPGTRVCVPCGIHVVTGRAVLTAEQGDTDRTYEHARGILWFASWILPFGLLPISSEAHGSRTPYALRAIALVTLIVTLGVWWFEWTGSPQMRELKTLFLWTGDRPPDEEHIESFYEYTDFGDRKAFQRKKAELSEVVPAEQLAIEALNALPPRQRSLGTFHVWQLFTCALLHGGILHLAGNMLFLILFGSRINALIGSVGTLLLYPLFAMTSSLAQMAAMHDEMPIVLLGASGAINGLAGLYFVLFPVSPVHVAIYLRIIPLFFIHMFKCRGFWILLYFLAWDLLYTLMAWESGTAHWAHLGGFITGVVVGLVLLITRAVNARGNDLLSAMFGRHAWKLIGKPSQWEQEPEGEGWLTRLTILPRSVVKDLASLGRTKKSPNA